MVRTLGTRTRLDTGAGIHVETRDHSQDWRWNRCSRAAEGVAEGTGNGCFYQGSSSAPSGCCVWIKLLQLFGTGTTGGSSQAGPHGQGSEAGSERAGGRGWLASPSQCQVPIQPKTGVRGTCRGLGAAGSVAHLVQVSRHRAHRPVDRQKLVLQHLASRRGSPSSRSRSSAPSRPREGILPA